MTFDKFLYTPQDGTEKRTKDTYGPPMGKRLMIFLDDLNMPRMDQYGTQQPIALLKLLIDRKVAFASCSACQAAHITTPSFAMKSASGAMRSLQAHIFICSHGIMATIAIAKQTMYCWQFVAEAMQHCLAVKVFSTGDMAC